MFFDMPSCGGCRTCEMACSFRHREEFIPAISSIKILDRMDEAGFRVFLVDESGGHNIPCDGCKGLPIPVCVEHCQKDKDLQEILKAFLESVKL